MSKVKKLAKVTKVGHTGTLDKFAEGLMILPFGKYTAFSDYFLKRDKTYHAKVKYGKLTDSGDKEGNVILQWGEDQVKNYLFDNKDKILKIINDLVLETTQIPPKISALKISGKRQSDLFRKGVEFDSKFRSIKIYFSNILSMDENGIEFEIKVSSGTYIRKIIIDISEKLNFPMYLDQLIRTSIDQWDLKQSIQIESFETNSNSFKSIDEMVSIKSIEVDYESILLVRKGRYLENLGELEGDFLLKSKTGELIAWCSLDDKKNYLPYKYKKVF